MGANGSLDASAGDILERGFFFLKLLSTRFRVREPLTAELGKQLLN